MAWRGGRSWSTSLIGSRCGNLLDRERDKQRKSFGAKLCGQAPSLPELVIASLLKQSKDPANWPFTHIPWNIHDCEGWLCEYDKWARHAYEAAPTGRKYTPYKY